MNQLISNQPVNPQDPFGYRQEAQASYTRGAGALALTAGALYGGARLMTAEVPGVVSETFFRNLPLVGLGFHEARTAAGYAEMMGLRTGAGGVPKWRFGDVLMEGMKRLEELSPSHILRTFGGFEHLVPLATRRGVTYSLSGAQAVEQASYLQRLTGKSAGELTELMLSRGVTLEEGKLFLEAGMGAERQLLLEHAHLMMRKYVPPGAGGEAARHFGRIAPQYERVIMGEGGGPGLRHVMTGLAGPETRGARVLTEADVPSFMIAGGRSKAQSAWRYAQATSRTWSQRFFKILDDPFLGIMEVLRPEEFDAAAAAARRSGLSGSVMGGASKIWEATKFKNKLGLGGEYTGSTSQMFMRWLRPQMMKGKVPGTRFFRPGAAMLLLGVPLAYHAIDQMLSDTDLFEGTVAEAGIPGLAAEGYERFAKARSYVGKYTGMQRFTRWQEEAAPGSTAFTGAFALPLAGGITGAFAGYGRRLIASGLGDPVAALAAARIEKPLPALLRKVPLDIFKRSFGRTARWGLTGLAIGAALTLPFLPGVATRLLGGAEPPEELDKIFSGEEDVPVMRSRWWIFGRTPFSGKKVDYYIPHWTVRARSRARDAALFPDAEEAPWGEFNWMFRAVKKTPLLQDMVDPYYFEKEHYRTRPYPVTGPTELGMGPLDPLYKSTVGRIFKPVRYMHTEEWAQGGVPKEWEPRPKLAPEAALGGEAPYAPRDPYSYDELARSTLDYYSDAIGIVGWIGRLVTRKAVGELTPYDVRPELESASRIAGVKRAYWDASLGDPLGMTEAYRRLNPRRDRGQYYSPIKNLMPDWMPGEEYFIDFMTGDPYAKILRGEYRLPGPGYEALHPELRGIPAADYPEFSRFKILADVAPYSDQYKYYNARMSMMAREGAYSQQTQDEVKQIRKQVRDSKTRKRFAEKKTAEEYAELDFAQQALGDVWDITSRLETPVEQVIFPPIAPMAKLLHRRTAMEDYERSQIYGTDQSFWHRLWDNFLRPGFFSFANTIGYEGVPGHIEEIRDTEAYFDKLKYIKALRLEEAHKEKGDYQLARLYHEKRRETMAGMNPYGNPLYILRSLPKRERDYWKAFQAYDDPEKQKRIMELVPPDVREVYRASWLRTMARDMRRGISQNVLDEKDQKEAHRVIGFVEEDMQRQGQPISVDLARGFQRAVDKGKAEPHQYADWYRAKEIQEYFQSHKLPGTKWIGWDPRVDLEDIKMKYVRQEGYDFHDFDLWEDRLYAMTRKPYLDEALEDIDMDDYNQTPEQVQERLQSLLEAYGADSIFIAPVDNGGEIEMSLRDDQADAFHYEISKARW